MTRTGLFLKRQLWIWPIIAVVVLSAVGFLVRGAIESTMKNGVLIVRVPKKKETIRQEKRKNARRISIKG